MNVDILAGKIGLKEGKMRTAKKDIRSHGEMFLLNTDELRKVTHNSSLTHHPTWQFTMTVIHLKRG